jgi:hypothetical protein
MIYPVIEADGKFGEIDLLHPSELIERVIKTSPLTLSTFHVEKEWLSREVIGYSPDADRIVDLIVYVSKRFAYELEAEPRKKFIHDTVIEHAPWLFSYSTRRHVPSYWGRKNAR